MNCPNCGLAANAVAKFCTNCGETLTQPAVQTPAPPGSVGADPAATIRAESLNFRAREQLPTFDEVPATVAFPSLPSTGREASSSVAPGTAPPRTKHKWYRPGVQAFAIITILTVLGCVLASATSSPGHAESVWRIARATGFIAYGLLTLSVAFGLIVATQWRAFTGLWLVCERLHPLILLAAAMVLAFHIAALLLLSFPITDTFVPFMSVFDTPAITLGIFAMYLMGVLLASTYLMGYIGYRLWRRLHYAGLIAWILALGHGVRVGNDSGELWAKFMYAGGALLVVVLLAVYLIGRMSTARRRSAASVPAPG